MWQREMLCAALAAGFTTTVVVPGILIFADRSVPFQVVDASMIERAATPGERVHFRLTVRKVGKECRGHVDRIFIDSTGRVFPLDGKATTYQFFPTDKQGVRVVERVFSIPDEAQPGEGTYISFPQFWCYPLQFLVPVKAEPLRAKIAVMPKGTKIENPRELIVVPPASVR